jgi:hypothetical protein
VIERHGSQWTALQIVLPNSDIPVCSSHLGANSRRGMGHYSHTFVTSWVLIHGRITEEQVLAPLFYPLSAVSLLKRWIMSFQKEIKQNDHLELLWMDGVLAVYYPMKADRCLIPAIPNSFFALLRCVVMLCRESFRPGLWTSDDPQKINLGFDNFPGWSSHFWMPWPHHTRLKIRDGREGGSECKQIWGVLLKRPVSEIELCFVIHRRSFRSGHETKQKQSFFRDWNYPSTFHAFARISQVISSLSDQHDPVISNDRLKWIHWKWIW